MEEKVEVSNNGVVIGESLAEQDLVIFSSNTCLAHVVADVDWLWLGDPYYLPLLVVIAVFKGVNLEVFRLWASSHVCGELFVLDTIFVIIWSFKSPSLMVTTNRTELFNRILIFKVWIRHFWEFQVCTMDGPDSIRITILLQGEGLPGISWVMLVALSVYVLRSS